MFQAFLMSNVPTVCLTPECANDINTDSFDELTKKMEDMANKSEEDQEQIQNLKEQIVIAEEAAKIKNLPVEVGVLGPITRHEIDPTRPVPVFPMTEPTRTDPFSRILHFLGLK